MFKAAECSDSGNEYTLNSVREALVRKEDTIVFGLIERAKFPINSHTYDEKYAEIKDFCGSLVDFVVKSIEAVQAKVLTYMVRYTLCVAQNCFISVGKFQEYFDRRTEESNLLSLTKATITHVQVAGIGDRVCEISAVS
ncbi:Chorismate mutase type II superfamily [Sesbania bispinosa]|nr:Chorismate mutase type II superfamily [Sesbania bispinosa]